MKQSFSVITHNGLILYIFHKIVKVLPSFHIVRCIYSRVYVCVFNWVFIFFSIILSYVHCWRGTVLTVEKDGWILSTYCTNIHAAKRKVFRSLNSGGIGVDLWLVRLYTIEDLVAIWTTIGPDRHNKTGEYLVPYPCHIYRCAIVMVK